MVIFVFYFIIYIFSIFFIKKYFPEEPSAYFVFVFICGGKLKADELCWVPFCFFIFKETLDIMKCADLSNLQMTFLNVAVKAQWQFA